MKKLILILIVLMLSIVMVLFTGCNETVVPPIDEEPSAEILALIKEYTGTDQVLRWAEGIVNVYDGTNCEWVGDILDEINVAIDGPVIFKLNDNYNNSQIKIIFEDLTGTGMGQAQIDVESNDEYEIFNVGIKIDPLIGVEQPIYVCVLLVAVGIDIEKWFDGLTQEMKTVLYWLYRLGPGYPLI